jgi:hypothetical protein
MRLNLAVALGAGALIVAACGDDSGSSDDTKTDEKDSSTSSATAADAGSKNDASAKGDAGSSTSENTNTGGSCGKGAYKFAESMLQLCGAGAEDGNCDPIAKAAGYTSFNGDVEIFPGTDSDLAALKCFSQAGMVELSGGTELKNLEGLSGLSKINGLSVTGLDKLTSLSGLDGLKGKSIVELTISGNAALTDITGLPDGLSVDSVYISGNVALVSLAGLKGLKITNSLAIENNPKLSSCAAAAFAKDYPGVEFSNFGNKTETCP